MIVRSVKHHLSAYVNADKLSTYNAFIDYCFDIQKYLLDYFWDNDHIIFNITKDKLDVPNMISTTNIHYPGATARLLKEISTQVLGKIKSQTEVRKTRLFKLKELQKAGEYCSKLQSLIDRTPLSKPLLKKQSIEMGLNCAYLEKSSVSHFDYFLTLKSILEVREEIEIPIKLNDMDIKYNGNRRLSSFLLKKDCIEIRYEIEVEKKEEGRKIGIDPGYKDCITTSDGIVSPRDRSGRNLQDIIDIMANMEWGSQRFKRWSDYRDNYIHWAVKQIDLDGIKEVGYEEVYDIRRGKDSSRNMKHWNYPLIQNAMMLYCEVNGVHFTLQDSSYRSQRCSSCGWTQKSNRKGKEFMCKHCGFTCDADHNAALNHMADLPEIGVTVRHLKMNRKGFFFLPNAICDKDGQVLTEPVVNEKSKKMIFS